MPEEAAILSDLYLAASRQVPFDEAWRACVGWVGGRSSAVGLFDTVGAPTVLAFPETDARAIALYAGRYVGLDPFAGALMAAKSGQIVHGSEVIDPVDYKRSEFFNDFVRQMASPVEHFLGAAVVVGPGRTLRLGLQRAPGEADFDAAHAQRLARVCDHLPGVFKVWSGVEQLARSLAAYETLANANTAGAAIICADGRIEHTNTQAELICAAYRLTSSRMGSRVALCGRGVPHGLETRLARVAEGGKGETILIRADGLSPLLLELAWLPAGMGESCAWMPQRSQARVLATFRVLDNAQGSPEKLRRAFGLSKTEADVALQLAGGEGVAEIAQARGVSVNTLRTQIRSILTKTQCRSLRELGLLINRI